MLYHIVMFVLYICMITKHSFRSPKSFSLLIIIHNGNLLVTEVSYTHNMVDACIMGHLIKFLCPIAMAKSKNYASSSRTYVQILDLCQQVIQKCS